MTVDLTKLKAGDSVRILDSVLDVENIVDYRSSSFELTFKNHETKMEYYKDGQYFVNPSIMDILEIIPAPFDWSKVKQGDAFENALGYVVYFVAQDWFNKEVVLSVDKTFGYPSFQYKDELKPRPDLNLF